jgi:hypothetical protein
MSDYKGGCGDLYVRVALTPVSIPMSPCVFVIDQAIVPRKRDRKYRIEDASRLYSSSKAPHACFSPTEEPIYALFRNCPIVRHVPVPLSRTPARAMRNPIN